MFKHYKEKKTNPDQQWLAIILEHKEVRLDSRIPWAPVLTWWLTIYVTVGKVFHSLSLSFFFFFFVQPEQHYYYDLMSRILSQGSPELTVKVLWEQLYKFKNHWK